MYANQGTTHKPDVNLCPSPEVVDALKNILARSHVPDLETSYSRFPNTHHFAVGLKDQSIREVINDREQQSNAILHDISDLETVREKITNLHQHLIEKHDKITQSKNLHKGLLSPLWRLPAEILSQIFVNCLPETYYLRVSPKLAPLLLIWICRRWRKVAVDMSCLWCRLSMEDVAVYRGCNWQKPIFCRYDSWLKRSRGHPLSLALKHNESDLTDVIRSVLQQYRSQITSVTFLNAVALEFLANDLPSLQTLTMKSCLNSQYDSAAFAHSISQLPSTLRSLRLIGGCIFDWEHLLSFNPVWTHLTNVEIALFGADVFLDLLQRGPNLSSATIILSFSYVSVVQPFTHTKLQSLRLVYDSESERPCQLLDLFNALSFPDLRVLEACHAEMQWPHEKFKAFLARSKCPLEMLTLGAEMTTDKQKAEYVALIPSLKILVAHVPHAHPKTQ